MMNLLDARKMGKAKDGFRVLPIKDRELFLRYAVPCGEVLVKRGEVRSELLGRLNGSVRHRQDIDYPIEGVFKVASRMCTIIAKQMGKSEIDAEVIRRYFLVEHEQAIRWRQQVRPELRLEECLVYPGRVLRIADEGILVKTPLGERMFRADFAEGLRVRDWVSVHYDYVAERLKESHANRMRTL
jgi:hydrogenase maturation factor